MHLINSRYSRYSINLIKTNRYSKEYCQKKGDKMYQIIITYLSISYKNRERISSKKYDEYSPKWWRYFLKLIFMRFIIASSVAHWLRCLSRSRRLWVRIPAAQCESGHIATASNRAPQSVRGYNILCNCSDILFLKVNFNILEERSLPKRTF